MPSLPRPSLVRTAAVAVGAAALAAVPAHAGGDVELTREIVGLFSAPMYLTAPPDDDRLFVVERAGRIRVVKDGSTLATPFLDISSLVSTTFEGGFLGLAFDPDYDANGHFYVHYTRPGLVSVVARYTVSAGDPDVADPGSAVQLLELNQPADNHNGGWIGFSPNDDNLYVAFGDGGFSGSGPSRAQDITGQLLGKILRIDPDGDDFPGDPDRNYAIPADNPFVGVPGDDEIWLYGLRNPFRCGFDPATGDLYIGDVGETSREEVDFVPADSAGGLNFGWGCMEGTLCLGSFCTCNDPSLELPIHEYPHSGGRCSITGGSVYRGCVMPALDGTYFFGDFCSGNVYSLRYDGTQVTDFQDRTAELVAAGLSSISRDAQGELYMTSLNGPVWRIIPVEPPADENGNGIPDSCEEGGPVGDLDGDGDVDFDDLVSMLAAWGPCPGGCPADLTGDEVVGFDDLLALLAAWS